MQKLIDFLVSIAPLLAALGLFSVLSRGLRFLWDQAKIAAGKTPTKIDDVIIHLVEPSVEAGLALIERGQTTGNIREIETGISQVRQALKAVKTK